MDARDRRDGAGCAEQVKIRTTRFVLHAVGERRQLVEDASRHRFERFAADFMAAELLGERDHAEAQGFPGADALAGRFAGRSVAARLARQPDAFRRSAADVEENDRARIAIGERATTGGGEMRLRLAVDALE